MVDVSLQAVPANGAFARLRERLNREAWIAGPQFDLPLLIFVPLLTLPILAGLYFHIRIVAIGGGLMLAFAHYWSSIAFYFWDENKAYHRERWLAFYAGPVMLAVVYCLLLGFHVPYVIQFVLFFWNTWHVSRQNCGVLALYRSRAGVAEPEQKSAANNAIIAVSTFLAVWNIRTHEEVAALLSPVTPHWSLLLKGGAAVVAAFFAVRLGIALYRRQARLGLPETIFLAASLAFFYPYIFMTKSEVATYAMLLPHYVQYMALVWLLHRRKFGGADHGAHVVLRRMSSRLVYLVPVLVAVGGLFYLINDYTMATGNHYWFESLYLLIALEHFYLDGLIWSFRRPHVRQTILPFLTRPPQGLPPQGISP